ncbi:MAG: sugar transporter [Deltaproteobacteria bacterium]|nr:sugar transporter [Deltaproteobacteria bacterium]
MCFKRKVSYFVLAGFLIIAVLLSAGCARNRDLVAGTVKDIKGNGTETDLKKPDPQQSYNPKAKSSVVEMESVTIPPPKEPPPPADYIVGPNDTLMVTVAGHPEFSTGLFNSATANTANVFGTQRGCRVDGSGYIQIPTLGLVRVAGLSLPQIRSHIQGLLVKYLQEPSVVVEVTQYNSQPLYILGQFKNTGVFYMDRPFNVLQGMAMGGGYDLASANPKSARIIRDKKVLPVDVYELLMRADQTQNIWLKPGDTIFMPDNKNQVVFVFGAGKTGMSIPLPPTGLNLLQAIAMAGFQEVGYHARRVFLIRSLSTTKGQLMVVDVDMIVRGDALPVELCEGDVIYIPKSAMTSWNEAVSELLPTLQAFGAILSPFVQAKYLFRD